MRSSNHSSWWWRQRRWWQSAKIVAFRLLVKDPYSVGKCGLGRFFLFIFARFEYYWHLNDHSDLLCRRKRVNTIQCNSCILTGKFLRRKSRSVNVRVRVLLFNSVRILEELVDLFADDFGVLVEVEALAQRNRVDLLPFDRARQQLLVAHFCDLFLHFHLFANLCIIKYF